MPEKQVKEKKETIEKTLVVKDLPTQPVRKLMEKEDSDEVFNLLTTEEALTEILERLVRIEKRLTN